MRKRLLDMLKTLEAVVPPPEGKHHEIVFSQYGCADSGFEDRLALRVLFCDCSHRVMFLDDGDFDACTPAEFAEAVKTLLTSPIGTAVKFTS